MTLLALLLPVAVAPAATAVQKVVQVVLQGPEVHQGLPGAWEVGLQQGTLVLDPEQQPAGPGEVLSLHIQPGWSRGSGRSSAIYYFFFLI